MFDDYVNDLYKTKAGSDNPVAKAVAKSLLNNLIGRFGLALDKPMTSLVDLDKLNDITLIHKIKSMIPIGDKFLVSHSTAIDKDVCDDFSVDYAKAVVDKLKNKKSRMSETTFRDVSIAISSAVNSYARIYMSKIKLDILNNNGFIYYSDTDSIVTNIKLSDSLVGPEIGKFKLEHTVTKAMFISSKAYVIVPTIIDGKENNKNNEIVRFKGVVSKYITYKDMESLYNGNDVKAIRHESDFNLTKGYTTILLEKKITLKHDMYNKRDKVFINGIWIDTNIKTINTLDDDYNYINNVNVNNNSSADIINKEVTSLPDFTINEGNIGKYLSYSALLRKQAQKFIKLVIKWIKEGNLRNFLLDFWKLLTEYFIVNLFFIALITIAAITSDGDSI